MELTITDALKYEKILKKANDKDKLKILDILRKSNFNFEIKVDNDDVYIHLVYDEDDESIGCSFDEFGYDLLVTLFQFNGFNADLV